MSTEQIGQGQPFRADTTSPAYAAMAEAMAVAYPGQEMQYAGQGGSIPLCNTLASLYPQAEILLIGLSEPEAQIHAVNESVSPEELERLSVAEALFLRNYAARRARVRSGSSSAGGPGSGRRPHAIRAPAARRPRGQPTGTPASR